MGDERQFREDVIGKSMTQDRDDRGMLVGWCSRQAGMEPTTTLFRLFSSSKAIIQGCGWDTHQWKVASQGSSQIAPGRHARIIAHWLNSKRPCIKEHQNDQKQWLATGVVSYSAYGETSNAKQLEIFDNCRKNVSENTPTIWNVYENNVNNCRIIRFHIMFMLIPYSCSYFGPKNGGKGRSDPGPAGPGRPRLHFGPKKAWINIE